MRLPCYSKNKRFLPNTLLYISNKAKLRFRFAFRPLERRNVDESTYPTFQGVWPNLYVVDKFNVHVMRTLTFYSTTYVLSVAKLQEHYYRINSKRYYFTHKNGHHRPLASQSKCKDSTKMEVI